MSSIRAATSFPEKAEPAASTSTVEKLCREFSLAEIQSATGDFSEERVIGIGGFGKVFKGVIKVGNESVIVAVKRQSSGHGQGNKEFVTEIKTLTKLRHVNVVSLIGYCDEEGEMILVYEYIANGTLADHLHKRRSSLTWSERIDICIRAGRGLHYLHFGRGMIHRDVKSSNILLDENLVAKVSDFGLAKNLSDEISQSVVSSKIMGSKGYIDPYIFKSFKQTMESDIYAFAVVLLEALSERLAFDVNLPKNEQLLAEWAKEKFLQRKIDEIVAPNLREKISKRSLKTFVGIAIQCLDPRPELRPTMTQVLAELEAAFTLQQERRKTSIWPFNASRSKVITSAAPVIQDDSLEDRQNANMLPIAVLAIQLVELKKITRDFSVKCMIGNESSLGRVFHGVLKTGHQVAIKKLNKNLPGQEFLTVVSTVSSLEHVNVAKFHGYCGEGSEQILVYEFAHQGSLHDALHGRHNTEGSSVQAGQGRQALSWVQRVVIAIEAAKGLQYIHENNLIHRNIKSNNILLFDGEIVKITDCCVSCGDELYPFTLPSGCCHRPPECGCPGLSEKGDVYSFGVVLLEILTGRKPLDPTPDGENLVTWATPRLGKADMVKTIVDARLEGNYPLVAAAGMAELAAYCIGEEADFRPDMESVLKFLKKVSWETQTSLQKHQQPFQRRLYLSRG